MIAQWRYLGICWDLFWLVSAGWLAYAIRGYQAPSDVTLPVSNPYLLASAAIGLVLWHLLNIKRRSFRLATQQDGHRLGLIAIAAPVLGLLVSFLFNAGESLPRSIPILHAGLLLAGLMGIRLAGRTTWHFKRAPKPADDSLARRARAQSTWLVGDGPGIAAFLKARQFVHLLEARNLKIFCTDPRLVGLTIRGKLIAHHAPVLAQLAGDLHHWRGNSSPLASDPASPQPPLVIAVPSGAHTGSLRATIAAWPGPVRYFGIADAAAEIDDHAGLDAGLRLHGRAFNLPAATLAYLPLKRLMDVAAALVLLALTAAPFWLATVGVRLVLGNPVFFWQWRPGRHGRGFKLIKLRSMRNPVSAQGKVLSDEERLGRFGSFLRRSRLDEVPQLWSILIGEMSLIGPRPLIQQQQRPDSRRLLLRPGLTGWAQVNGGQLLSADDKEDLDVWYVDRAGLLLDLKIMLLTVRAVLWGDKVPDGRGAKANPLAGSELSNTGYDPVQPRGSSPASNDTGPRQ
jgi:lipopolysaccharide/colanic/teichoic acid biosynthesis glycosyltransferase